MKNENEKGITLVALIITVIILIFLLRVSVDVFVDNDFLGEAKNVADSLQNQANIESNKEENIKNTWQDLPGKTVKSPTQQN